VQEHLRQSHILEGSEPLPFIGLDGGIFTPDRWLQLRQAKGRVYMKLGTYEETDDEDSTTEDGDASGSQTPEEGVPATSGSNNSPISLDQDLPGLPRYLNVPPFLSWNAPKSSSSVGDPIPLLEIFEVLNYIESNLARPSVVNEITGRVSATQGPDIIGSDLFIRSPEADYADVRSRVQALTSSSVPSSFTRVESDASLLSPLERMDEAKQYLLEVFQATNYLLDTFTPKDVNHSVARKFYGAILTIVNVSRQGGGVVRKLPSLQRAD
jgi:hypothetical protein